MPPELGTRDPCRSLSVKVLTVGDGESDSQRMGNQLTNGLPLSAQRRTGNTWSLGEGGQLSGL